MTATRVCTRTPICLALLILITASSCKPEEANWYVLKQYDTPEWSGQEGMLSVKTQSPDSDILLIRLRPFDEGMGDLFGFNNPQVANWRISDDEKAEQEKKKQEKREKAKNEVIYRFDPKEDPIELERVDLKAWNDATGPAWYGVQQMRRVPEKLRVVLITGRLNYKANLVQTVGHEIAHMAKSMSPRSKQVAILSATLRTDLSRSDDKPRLKNFYHQIYDYEKLEIVGRPVPLPFESEFDTPQGVWAGRDTYTVYTGNKHDKVYIVVTESMLDW